MRKLVAFVVGLSVVLTIANWILLSQVRHLTGELDACRNLDQKAYQADVGTTAPPLEGHDLKGSKVRLDYGVDSRPVLVFVFSPHCGICDDNWVRWHELLEKWPQRVGYVAVDLTSTVSPDYVQTHGLERFPIVIKEVDPKCLVALRMRLVPQSILIGAEGTVQGVWLGALGSDELAEIQSLVNQALKEPQA